MRKAGRPAGLGEPGQLTLIFRWKTVFLPGSVLGMPI